MLRFRHNEKLAIFQKLIIASERDQSRDEDRHKMLLRLLAEEEAKDKPPPAKAGLRRSFGN